ncbi:MAG: response regulator, partial [Rhodospirillales bacterium]|nr:response regulator [Rhodospirillales bacterium]
VDDSKTVRIIVRKAFKSYDCEILEASNGVEGLAIAAKDSPDLVLLDVRMPHMDGLALQQRLCEKGVDLPIIFLTGVVKTAEMMFKGYSAGASIT